MPRGAKCVKVRYKDQATAKAVADLDARVQYELRGTKIKPFREYSCDKCRGWHLTSQR